LDPIKCFFVEPTGIVELYLRRYSRGDAACSSGWPYHNAMSLLGDAPAVYVTYDDHECPNIAERPEQIDKHDPRWPVECICGYKFTPKDHYQIFQESVYRRHDTGEEFSLRHLPLGAMYFADWFLRPGKNHWRGPDNHCLVVMVPGKDMQPREWMVDGRANNCDLPHDTDHRCWVRHGQVPEITVDKNGRTCNAGAGSIKTDGWHGFLRSGYLVDV
jgi:hypothetical protein